MSKREGWTGLKIKESTKNFLDQIRKGNTWDRFLLDLARKPRNLQSDSPNPMTSPAISINPPSLPPDVDTCYKRIFFPQEEATWWCANRPPIMKPLATLDICKVCVAQHSGKIGKDILEKAQEPAPLPEPQQEQKKDANWRQKKHLGMDRYGMKWCEEAGGTWVFPTKCSDLCKNVFCQHNPRHKKEGVKSNVENTEASTENQTSNQ